MARRAACIIGWPVQHSRSPMLHGYWIKTYGIDGDYRHEEVRPKDFATFIGALAERGYVGANVTQPHKEQAFRLTEPDARAKAVGASNTLWFDAGRLKSTNTDVEGFTGSIDATAAGWDKLTSSAVVIGAGGAGRAIVYGLIERGIKEIHLVNRTLDKANAISRGVRLQYSSCTLERHSEAAARRTSRRQHDVARHEGYPELDIDLAPMASDGVVADIVYIPLKQAFSGRLRRWASRPRTVSTCCCIRRCAASSCGSACDQMVTAEQRAMLVADIEGSS